MKTIRARFAAAVIFVLLAAGAVPPTPPSGAFTAQAQNLGQRIVSGAVIDGDAKAIVSATVFLRNQKTKAIRSYTSTQDGRFRFSQVNMADDFDLWAEKDGKKSTVKTVSSWDARKEFEAELKIK